MACRRMFKGIHQNQVLWYQDSSPTDGDQLLEPLTIIMGADIQGYSGSIMFAWGFAARRN